MRPEIRRRSSVLVSAAVLLAGHSLEAAAQGHDLNAEHAPRDVLYALSAVPSEEARSAVMALVGAATEVAYLVRTYSRCPSGEKGAVVIRSEKPL